MFDSRENERKEKKMRGEESSGKTPAQSLYSSKEKNQDRSTRFHLSLSSAQISKNTKIPSIPIIHEGKNGKNHKKEVKPELNGAKKTRKCRGIFTPFCEALDFPAFSTLLSFWFLICNAKFDSNSTCLDRLDKFGSNSLQKL